MSAIFSDCGKYRYYLKRDLDLDSVFDKPAVFIMLNPSTADAEKDDPTIRRCKSFARDWGYTELIVVNLFAYRATDPNKLYKTKDPIGPLNDEWILKAINIAERKNGVVVCAWGAHGSFQDRGKQVLHLIKQTNMKPTCLKMTKSGNPSHPLYLKSDLRPQII